MKIIYQPNSFVTLLFETSMLVKLFPSIFVQRRRTLDYQKVNEMRKLVGGFLDEFELPDDISCKFFEHSDRVN